MARRLPVYLLLDTSGSMIGEPIEAVKVGLQTMLNSLRQDPSALETVWLSIITFDSEVKQLIQLTELEQFALPPINGVYKNPPLPSSMLSDLLTLRILFASVLML